MTSLSTKASINEKYFLVVSMFSLTMIHLYGDENSFSLFDWNTIGMLLM